MVIDTSAIIAILFGEPEAERIIDAVEQDTVRLIGAPTLVEAGAVMLGKKGPGGVVALDALIQRLDITVEPFTASAGDFARSAYARFGKGVGSPAVLNYGDCLSYGVAQSLSQPLLFRGADFTGTDVSPVGYQDTSTHEHHDSLREIDPLSTINRPLPSIGPNPVA